VREAHFSKKRANYLEFLAEEEEEEEEDNGAALEA
jgi:hypothetical protein